MRAAPRPQKSSMAFNLLPAIDQIVLPRVCNKDLLFIRVSKGMLSLSDSLGIG